jgi:uncharacterized protein YkwD
MTKMIVTALLVSSWTAFPLLASDDVPLTENETIVAMFKEMNDQRVRAGLPEMVLDKELCDLSQRWSNRMASTGSFHHGGGENVIARGQKTPVAAIGAWLRSPAHRAFLMGRSTRVGFGAQRGAGGMWYWSGTFR